MKTFTKVVLNIALILLVLGVVIGGIALAMGANPVRIGDNFQHGWFTSSNYNRGNFEVAYFANQEDTIDAAGLRNLHFEIGLGEARIQQGENFEIIFANQASRDHFYHYRRGDTWHIGSREYNLRGWNFWRNNRDDLRIIVTIPSDFVAERAYIAVGMGVLRMENLAATRFNLDIGMGSATIDSLSAERLAVTVGMGALEVNNCTADNIFVDVGMGSVDISLTRPVANYRGLVSGGLGSANIGTHRFSGVFNSSFGASDAPYYIEINVGMGSVDIN